MKYSMAYYTALGKRNNNEDWVLAADNGNSSLAIVADGLGGYANGEYASHKAVETIASCLLHKEMSLINVQDVVENAVTEANDAVRGVQKNHPGALTTIALLWLGDKHSVAAHVGDTRIYQFRNGHIIYQSLDHSVSQLAVMAGDIKPEEIRGHKERNVLTKVLGMEYEPKATVSILDVLPGDRFLVCSDGFWESITEEQMELSVAASSDVKSWLGIMRKIAEPNAKDNNSAVVLMVL